jgi:hypothetical protein
MTNFPLILAGKRRIAGTDGLRRPPMPIPMITNARSRQGAILGGLTGAVLGGTSGDATTCRGAAVRRHASARRSGGAVGASLDQQAAELRGSLNSNISVTNTGEFLIVNMPQDVLFETDSATLQPVAPDPRHQDRCVEPVALSRTAASR